MWISVCGCAGAIEVNRSRGEWRGAYNTAAAAAPTTTTTTSTNTNASTDTNANYPFRVDNTHDEHSLNQ